MVTVSRCTIARELAALATEWNRHFTSGAAALSAWPSRPRRPSFRLATHDMSGDSCSSRFCSTISRRTASSSLIGGDIQALSAVSGGVQQFVSKPCTGWAVLRPCLQRAFELDVWLPNHHAVAPVDFRVWPRLPQHRESYHAAVRSAIRHHHPGKSWSAPRADRRLPRCSATNPPAYGRSDRRLRPRRTCRE